MGQKQTTSHGDVRHPVGPADVDGVGQQAEERLGHQGEVPGVLHQLQGGRAEAEPVGHVEVEGQPREAPEALDPVAKPTKSPHSALVMPLHHMGAAGALGLGLGLPPPCAAAAAGGGCWAGPFDGV